jgi:hypothetical protein
MKKILFAFLLLNTTCIYLTQAQSKLSFGPRVAFTVMPVEKTENLGSKYQLGFTGGAFLNYNVNHWFSIRPELNYSLKKQFSNSEDTANIVDALGPLVGFDPSSLGLPEGVNLNAYSNTQNKHVLHYIEIPVLATFNLSNVKLSVGPFVGLLAGAKTKSETSQTIPVLSLIDLGDQIPLLDFFLGSLFPGYNKPDFSETKGTTQFNKIDAGIISDITYQLDNNFNFGIRYQQGLIDYRNSYTGDKRLNSSIQILVGYRFGKGKSEGPIRRPHAYDGN